MTHASGAQGAGRLRPHLRGHLFLFEKRSEPAWGDATGARLLAGAAGLEALRLVVASSLPRWVLTPLLLALALLSVRVVGGLTLSRLGLRPWREWTLTERSYLLQVLVIANVVFPIVVGSPLRNPSVFVPYLFFGFHQEVVYRGMLQGELVRRWGTLAGILVANALYTLGPLHASYFASPPSTAIPMFAAIFAIGLLFGVLFRRSGNLWIPATMHAIGNAYIVAGT